MEKTEMTQDQLVADRLAFIIGQQLKTITNLQIENEKLRQKLEGGEEKDESAGTAVLPTTSKRKKD